MRVLTVTAAFMDLECGCLVFGVGFYFFVVVVFEQTILEPFL